MNHIYYIITENCNLHCSFCIRGNKLLQRDKYIPLDKFRDSCNILSELFTDCTIILTGGEPFLHPDFFRILQYCAERYKRVVINSNGSFSHSTAMLLKPFLKNNTYLQISLDGTERVHDSYRGLGAYKACINNLEILSDYSNHISISTTVLKENLSNVVLLAKELNFQSFHHWKVSAEQVVGHNFERVITAQEWNAFVDKILPLCRFQVHIKKMFCFELWDIYEEFLRCNAERNIIHSNCGIGRDKIYVTPNGDLKLCTCFPDTVGNLFIDNVNVIKSVISNKSKIKIDSLSPCYECKYKIICNGGCPGYSLKYFGSINKGDPRCPIVQQIHEKY